MVRGGRLGQAASKARLEEGSFVSVCHIQCGQIPVKLEERNGVYIPCSLS